MQTFILCWLGLGLLSTVAAVLIFRRNLNFRKGELLLLPVGVLFGPATGLLAIWDLIKMSRR